MRRLRCNDTAANSNMLPLRSLQGLMRLLKCEQTHVYNLRVAGEEVNPCNPTSTSDPGPKRGGLQGNQTSSGGSKLQFKQENLEDSPACYRLSSIKALPK